MSIPSLTDPILLTRGDLNPNPKLTNQIATLGNVAFTRPKAPHPEKWLIPAARFPNTQSVLDLVGKEGTIAVVLDQSRATGGDADLAVEVQAGLEDTKRGKLVAYAAIVPWAGGWEKEGAGVETGWEIKAVCVDGDERYLKKGLAIEVMGSLERHVIEKKREHLQRVGSDIGEKQLQSAVEDGKTAVLTLWILAIECLNGAYWRKRGYKEVRRGVYSGIWGCKTSFEIVVLKRDVEFSLD